MLACPSPIAFLSEELLQFIWQHRYYKFQDLTTLQGEPVKVLYPGIWNKDQGPDFLDARIMIGDILWVGHVELHLRTSYWDSHKHTHDSRYNNVVLHVVWQHDKMPEGNGAILPVLELQPLVAGILLQRYSMLMYPAQEVACFSQLKAVTSLEWVSWIERLAIERLSRKASYVLELLEVAGGHWEEVCWCLLARSFGMKVNASLFEQVAQTLPVTLLTRHRNSPPQLEALLMGQANLLNGSFSDKYPQMLQKEYHFLKHKYNLPCLKTQPCFLRMRPAAFPTLRMAQLAAVLSKTTQLFSVIKETETPEQATQFLNVTANDYWHYHYRPDEATIFRPKKPGHAVIVNVLINALIPLLFAYGQYKKEDAIKEKAVNWLASLPKEVNNITRLWAGAGVNIHNATDSQALIELTNNYCRQKKCLSCAIGNKILRA